MITEQEIWPELSITIQSYSPFGTLPNRDSLFEKDLAIDSMALAALISEVEHRYETEFIAEELSRIQAEGVGFLLKRLENTTS